MQVIKTYRFKIGTKIPFSEWPDRIHRFLESQNLTSHRFMCFFMGYLGYGPNTNGGKNYDPEEYKKNLERGACARIVKDCPELGPLQIRSGESRNLPDYAVIDKDDFPEEKILPLMNKIHRRYGFMESDLYYCDIDFFGKRSAVSGFSLYRDACADNFIDLSIEILQDGKILDASPYFKAFKPFFPSIRSSESMEILLSDAEKQAVEKRNVLAGPELEKSRAFFSERFFYSEKQNLEPVQYAVAPILKKLCKKHGYHYRYDDYTYDMEKRTARGNFLHCEILTGPSHADLSVIVSIRGLGFEHRLGVLSQAVKSQPELDDCLVRTMETVAEFEETSLPELEACFPENPDWFE